MEIKKEVYKKAKIPKAPKVCMGLIFALAFFVGEFVLGIYGWFERRVGPIITLMGIIGIWYWLFCIHRFHQILDALILDKYVISPGKAVGFHFIPVYNFYWIFKWPIELSKFINGFGNATMVSGSFIGLLLLISFSLYNFIDSAIGLTCIFLIGMYINKKIKRQVSYLYTKNFK